ncbi:unnamed protein product [Mytilus coruscus]|uniref:TIR domain-containing protein n=1 Tax=Mytilus coruscus TaxID=42192 RepID=A0A6J8B325_MYTCO|nr:unnamed protein product [Mytilus coruscus]
MDVSNVSNVSETVVIDEHRHQRRSIRRRERQKVIELFNKSSTHLDVIENIRENNSQQIINIISTLQKQNRKLLFKRQPDKSDADSQNHTNLEKENITDNGNIQNVSTSPSIITRKVSKEHNVEYSTFGDDSSPDSSSLLLDQTDNYGVHNVENNVYKINNNSHNTENSKGPKFKKTSTKVSDDNRLTHDYFEKPTKQNIPDQTSVASSTITTNSNISQPNPTAIRPNRSKSTTSNSKVQNQEDKPKQYASKSIKSAVNHDMVYQRRPNVDFPSEFCMHEATVHPKYNSCRTEKESIYEDVIPETLNNENCLSETWSNLSVRDEAESCFSDENSLTLEKDRATQYPATKDKDSNFNRTSDKSHRNYDIRSTAADSYTKQENAARWIQAETSSSGYCTTSRQLEVSTCDQETRNENNSSTKTSQTSVATVTSKVRQSDKVENESIPDDTTIDEEEQLIEDNVVELTKENERLERIIQKLIRKRTLKEKEAKLKKDRSKLIKQIEKETIQCSQGETTIVYERIDEETEKKEFVHQCFHLIPPDDKIDYHDVLILYNSDNDHDEAERFKIHLQNDFKLRNGRKIKAALYDGPELETHTNRKFQHLEKSFERCTLKFIFLTESFLDNDWANVCNESFIFEALSQNEYHYSIVPVHVHCDLKTSMGLNNLSGFKYYNRDNVYEKRDLVILRDSCTRYKENETIPKICGVGRLCLSEGTDTLCKEWTCAQPSCSNPEVNQFVECGLYCKGTCNYGGKEHTKGKPFSSPYGQDTCWCGENNVIFCTHQFLTLENLCNQHTDLYFSTTRLGTLLSTSRTTMRLSTLKPTPWTTTSTSSSEVRHDCKQYTGNDRIPINDGISRICVPHGTSTACKEWTCATPSCQQPKSNDQSTCKAYCQGNCNYGGKEYKVGETFTSPDGVNQCFCGENNLVMCSQFSYNSQSLCSISLKGLEARTTLPTEGASSSEATTAVEWIHVPSEMNYKSKCSQTNISM